MTKHYRVSVTEEASGKRVDVFLAEVIPELTRSQAKKLIKEGLVKVDGQLVRPKYSVKPGQRIEVIIPPPEKLELVPEEVPFEILYEDEDLAVINKPPGIVVHPAAGHTRGTLVHGLLAKLKGLSGIGGELRPGIVHRLDKDTSGLLVIAKNDLTHQALTKQFKAREVKKVYLALVHGVPRKKEGRIDLPIGRHPVHRKKMSTKARVSREAVTLWRVIKTFKKAALIEAQPLTGRTHQIRVHLAAIGHPIVGDPLYGGQRPQGPKAPRQMLHAFKLSLTHPRSGKRLEFQAELPKDFKEVLNTLASHSTRQNLTSRN